MVTFETVEAITGHPHLSAMRPRMDRDQTLQDVADASAALCQGVLSDVRRGDWLLLVKGTGKDLFRAETVTPDAPAQTTRISFTAQPVTPFILLPLLMTYYPLTTSFVGHALAPALVSSEIAGKRRKQIAIENELRSARIDTHKLSLHLNLRRFLLPVFPAPSGSLRPRLPRGRTAAFFARLSIRGSPPITPGARMMSSACWMRGFRPISAAAGMLLSRHRLP